MLKIRGAVWLLILALLSGFCTVSVRAASEAGALRYDVSYIWAHNFQNVTRYRKKIARILGDAVQSKLRIVKKGELYGLIYDRNGEADSTRKIALWHSQILISRGLEEAVPIISRRWQAVGEARNELSSGPNLEAKIEAYIKGLRRKGKIAPDERTAWSVYDFTDGKKLVSINENRPMQAASMVKPFFALALLHKAREGNLIYGSKSRRTLRNMIQQSSNEATNWVLRQLGGPRTVHRLLRRHYGGILRNTQIVEYIPPGGQTYRNKASAHDYSRFLYALWKGQIPGSKEIKRLMGLPNRSRLYTGAHSIPQGTRVYNKTGSTKRLCGDMGILVARGPNGTGYPYTLIGLIEKRTAPRNYTNWIRSRGDVIRKVSNMVYREIQKRHKPGRNLRMASR